MCDPGLASSAERISSIFSLIDGPLVEIKVTRRIKDPGYLNKVAVVRRAGEDREQSLPHSGGGSQKRENIRRQRLIIAAPRPARMTTYRGGAVAGRGPVPAAPSRCRNVEGVSLGLLAPASLFEGFLLLLSWTRRREGADVAQAAAGIKDVAAIAEWSDRVGDDRRVSM